jgi:hypothetical protein
MEDSDWEKPVCLAFKQRTGRMTIQASLDLSAQCGCRFCGAICEGRPGSARSRRLLVSVHNKSLDVTYYEYDGHASNRKSIRREFFVLSSKPESPG